MGNHPLTSIKPNHQYEGSRNSNNCFLAKGKSPGTRGNPANLPIFDFFWHKTKPPGKPTSYRHWAPKHFRFPRGSLPRFAFAASPKAPKREAASRRPALAAWRGWGASRRCWRASRGRGARSSSIYFLFLFFRRPRRLSRRRETKPGVLRISAAGCFFCLFFSVFFLLFLFFGVHTEYG